MKTLELLFGLRRRVGRKQYVLWGVGLAVLKLLLDTWIVHAFTGKTWSPLGYIVPSLILREDAVGSGPEAMNAILPALALPFLWIGLSMSVRRAADAGISAWVGTVFIVPLVHYVAIVVLCVLPTKAEASWAPPGLGAYRTTVAAPSSGPPSEAPVSPALRAALAGLLANVAIGGLVLWICIGGLKEYGLTLFFVTPFAMGASCAAIFNHRVTRSISATVGVALAGLALTGCGLLFFAIEGAFCILMAAPIVAVLATLGALLGRAIASSNRPPGAFMLMLPLAGLPAVALTESRLATPAPHDVTTEIEIDAPPERVWPNVVGFSDLDEPPQWFFRLGIAYPKRARIEGAGVGAVRRCEFSTGAFVEPITVWQPPERLAFDVTSQPPSMTEWSPYGAIHAPHVEGYMVSRGGEFDLERLPGGRTLLRGTTHYTLAIYPELYWIPYAEALLHAIHHRVLVHIKSLSEHA
ncbi:MAG TPA: DUF805 domain-containing protein [Polyangiaceae bacterium]|jgi:uncharacterized membrane protein YhaH (DUF805 family)|nr:DUF805 domain-containing protein [Polyangiaceae bacterium]